MLGEGWGVEACGYPLAVTHFLDVLGPGPQTPMSLAAWKGWPGQHPRLSSWEAGSLSLFTLLHPPVEWVEPVLPSGAEGLGLYLLICPSLLRLLPPACFLFTSLLQCPSSLLTLSSLRPRETLHPGSWPQPVSEDGGSHTALRSSLSTRFVSVLHLCQASLLTPV